MIVLVTGSRTLADNPAAVTWAREILSRELASATLVVAGDARGPDQWAHEIAQGMVAPITCERWLTDRSCQALNAGAQCWRRLQPWASDSTTTDPRRRPLERNVEMIAAYDLGPDGDTVRVVALRDARSSTHGTAHTAGLARAAGIEVTEYVWGGS